MKEPSQLERLEKSSTSFEIYIEFLLTSQELIRQALRSFFLQLQIVGRFFLRYLVHVRDAKVF